MRLAFRATSSWIRSLLFKVSGFDIVYWFFLTDKQLNNFRKKWSVSYSFICFYWWYLYRLCHRFVNGKRVMVVQFAGIPVVIFQREPTCPAAGFLPNIAAQNIVSRIPCALTSLIKETVALSREVWFVCCRWILSYHLHLADLLSGGVGETFKLLLSNTLIMLASPDSSWDHCWLDTCKHLDPFDERRECGASRCEGRCAGRINGRCWLAHDRALLGYPYRPL